MRLADRLLRLCKAESSGSTIVQCFYCRTRFTEDKAELLKFSEYFSGVPFYSVKATKSRHSSNNKARCFPKRMSCARFFRHTAWSPGAQGQNPQAPRVGGGPEGMCGQEPVPLTGGLQGTGYRTQPAGTPKPSGALPGTAAPARVSGSVCAH